VEAFAPCGFERAFYPCYGMAESTLFISGRRASGLAPRVLTVSKPDLDANRIVPVDAGETARIVSCGAVDPAATLIVVSPQTGMAVENGSVGEIWISSPSVAGGYFQNDAATSEVFGKGTRTDLVRSWPPEILVP
jgi:acyl-CoA synthetase (AMP-forming)/AMP-acid ligase II